ncbi:MAG: MFS transporter [Parvibaculaceae bacterium]
MDHVTASTESHGRPSAMLARLLLPACILNVSAGLLYAWSLFLLPLERALQVDRGSLSLVPSLAIATFTAGMIFCPWLVRRTNWRIYLAIVYGCMSVGFLWFGRMPSFASLLFGYGVVFGLGAGLAYGLALVFATSVSAQARALAIGVTVGAFAISGILMPPLFGNLIAASPPSQVFTSIGIGCIALGILIQILVRVVPGIVSAEAVGQGAADVSIGRDFMKLFSIFFFINFIGLMSVSQISGITSSSGSSGAVASWATSLFTFGYLLGSLGGGWVAERLGGRLTLIAAGVAMIAGLLAFSTKLSWLLLSGAITIGLAFGSGASFMPMLISSRFGAERVSQVYGRMMIAFGAAGLLAPWFSGFLYARTGTYTPSLVIGSVMAAMAIAVGGTFRTRGQAWPIRK